MASPRITGKYGALYLHVAAPPVLASVTKAADTYNVQFEAEAEMLECTRKGEGYRRYMPGVGGAKITCQAYFQALSQFLVMADDDLATGSLGPVVRVAFKLVTLSLAAAGASMASTAPGASTPAGQQIVQGFAWVNRASLRAPFDNKIEEELELMLDGDWAFLDST